MSAAQIIEFTKDKSVLLVDDEQDTLEILGTILKRLFKQVHLSSDGEQALEVLHNREYKIDLILSDVNMPIMNGITLYEKMQEYHIDIPFVFITANQELKYAAEYDVPYLKKPMSLDNFYQVLSDIYRK
jgi:DNA-binding NtrC family response regulator